MVHTLLLCGSLLIWAGISIITFARSVDSEFKGTK